MDEAEFQPPEPTVIARRSLILSGIVCRASLENYADEEYKRDTAALIHSWFDELSLWPYLEPCEEEIVRCPFDKMPKDVTLLHILAAIPYTLYQKFVGFDVKSELQTDIMQS